MLYEVKIRLLMPWLGSQKTQEQVRRFRKISRGDKEGEIELDRELWDWAYRQAIESLRFTHVDSTTIRAAMSIRCPTLVLYKRKYKSPNGKTQEEMFECITKGTILTFPLVVTSPQDKLMDKEAPTKKELETLFEFIGEFIGLSPWGSKFGYGTFTLENIEEK
jgi:hypothetical protein